MQARVAESAYAAQQAIERGDTVVVGVNAFVEPGGDAGTIPLQRINEAYRARAMRARARGARRTRLTAGRAAAWRRPPAAAGRDNLMPHFVEAVDAGATLGEICDVLRDVFGTYRAKEVVA